MKTARLIASVEANPDNPDLYRKLGESHFMDGRLGDALGAFLMALILDPENWQNRRNALKVLGMTAGYEIPGQVRSILERCASDRDLDTQSLASVIHTEFSQGSVADLLTEDLLQARYAKFHTDIERGLYASLFDDEFLKAVMVNAILVTPALERCFTALRAFALEGVLENGGQPNGFLGDQADFFAALACQCFNTEYVYEVSEEEEEGVRHLVNTLEQDTDIVTLSILACYRTLHDVPDIQVPEACALSPCQARMIERLIVEPAKEREIETQIPSLGAIDDIVSRKVRAQYETFPYPRWTSTEATATPVRFGKYLGHRFPRIRAKQRPQGPVQILIAGCGTGKQAIEVASAYKGATVTAIDLSRASLAYARARSEERGIDTIDFQQGDILELGHLASRYDLIECMGVLHHMADPAKGLDVLKGLLKPNGVLRLALYSTRARTEVRAAADFVREQGFDGSAPSIRAFRRKIYELSPGAALAEVVKTRDFFSLSGLHDYIFNVQEKTFTPVELKHLLDNAGLEFLGFDLGDVQTEQSYKGKYPFDRFMTNLDDWDRYEVEHPDTFGAMFQFWCRPTAASS